MAVLPCPAGKQGSTGLGQARGSTAAPTETLSGLVERVTYHNAETGFGELDELVLAYATTIHKAQGSEYPAVVIPLSTQHYAMLARNLLYTGVTRGKRLVVLVGSRRALAMAVRNGGARRRWSKLGEWLSDRGGASPRRQDRQRLAAEP